MEIYGAQKEKQEYGVHSKFYIFLLLCRDLPPEAMLCLIPRQTDGGINLDPPHPSHHHQGDYGSALSAPQWAEHSCRVQGVRVQMLRESWWYRDHC